MTWPFLLLAASIAPSTGEFHQPQLAVQGDVAAVVFGSGESIFVAQSHGNSTSFQTPVRVATMPGLNLGMHRGPRIAFTRDAMIVTAINGKTDGDLLSWWSLDKGKTWAGPSKVNDAPQAAREGLHAMVAMPNGRLFVTWLDLRHVVPGKPGTELYGSYSEDAGKTWSKNALVYHSPSGSICQCCHPSLDVDSHGVLHIMWRNAVDGNRDLYTASSPDGGKRGTGAAKLGNGSWKLEACPMDGGGLTHAQDGKVVTVWRREAEPVPGFSGPSGTDMGEGKNAAIAASARGNFVVWQSAKGIEALVPGKTAAEVLDGEGTFPQVAGYSNGNILAVWEHKGRLQFRIL